MGFDVYGPHIFPAPFKLSESVKKGQGLILDGSNAGQIKKNTIAGGAIHYVAADDAASGEYPYVYTVCGGQPRIKVRVGESVTVGEALMCDSDGDWVDILTTAGTYYMYVTTSEAGSNNGEVEAVWTGPIAIIVT